MAHERARIRMSGHDDPKLIDDLALEKRGRMVKGP